MPPRSTTLSYLLVGLVFLAGCSDRGNPDPVAGDVPDSVDDEGSDNQTTAQPEPIILSGTIAQTAGGCSAPVDVANMAPSILASSTAVPDKAWNRTFQGPSTDAAVDVGTLCVTWILETGEEVRGGSMVPSQAVTALVVGDAQARGTWEILVE